MLTAIIRLLFRKAGISARKVPIVVGLLTYLEWLLFLPCKA